MKTRILLAVVAVVVATMPTSAAAQQLFDFDGQALVPAMVGGTLDMVSVLRDPAPATTPLPLDFANFEYTLVVTGLSYTGGVMPQDYTGGTVTIYEDAGTAADYANPATFSDGTAILAGTFTGTATRMMFTATLGNFTGTVDWTGGSEINQFAPADRVGWAFVAGISARAGDVQPGYDEAWDGKVEPPEPVVDTAVESWGEVKSGY